MKRTTAMSKKALYFIIPLVLIAFVVIKLRSNKEIAAGKVYHYKKEQAIHVQTDTLQPERVSAEVSYSGTFEPDKETRISAETQAKINKVLVDVGSVVTKGQELILLDNSLLKLQLKAIQVQLDGLKSDVNRYTILVKADAIQGVQLEKAELALNSAKVQKSTLLEQIKKSTIRAPFSGIVTAKLSEEGAYAAPGIPLIQLTDIRRLRFTVNVPESDLSSFKLNGSYPITTDAYAGISLTGKVIMIGSKANMGSSFPVQFVVTNTSDWRIKSGMFGKVQANGTGSEDHPERKNIIISSFAIVGTADKPQVYLVEQGKAILHDITISKRIENKAIVSGGLKSGDVLVSNGLINLFDGANVTVK